MYLFVDGKSTKQFAAHFATSTSVQTAVKHRGRALTKMGADYDVLLAKLVKSPES